MREDPGGTENTTGPKGTDDTATGAGWSGSCCSCSGSACCSSWPASQTLSLEQARPARSSADSSVHTEWVGAHGLCANNVGLDGIDLSVDTVGIVM